MTDATSGLFKAYAGLVRHISLYMTINIVIILLLVIVIEVEIETRSRDIKDLVEDEETTKSSIDKKNEEMQELKKTFEVNVFKPLSETLGLSVFKESNLKDLRNKVHSSSKKTKNGKHDQIEYLIDNLKLLTSKLTKETIQETPETKKLLKDLGETISKISTFSTNIKETTDELTKLEETLSDYKKKQDELEDKPQSVPTPFGPFKLHPRLAFILIVLACVTLYIKLFTDLHQLQILVNMIDSDEANRQQKYIINPVPIWYFPQPSSELAKTVPARAPKNIYGVIAHTLYVGFCVFMVRETFRMNVPDDPIWYAVLVKSYRTLFSENFHS